MGLSFLPSALILLCLCTYHTISALTNDHQLDQLTSSTSAAAHHLRRHLASELAELAHLGKLISRINSTLDEVVDATLEQMHKTVKLGNICPFRRTVVTKMLRGERVKIIIAGGSVTYGADLRDRMRQRWSAHWEAILNSGWYAPGFEVVNLGTPACNVDYWLYRVRELSSADLVVVDLSVNDQGFDLQALPHLYHSFIQLIDDLPNHPSLLFHQAFRSGQRDPGEIQGHCPAVNASITCCEGILFCRKWYEMSDFVGITLSKLRVPSVSYRDLVWPDYFHPPNNLNLFWNGRSHPDYKAHQLFAKLIAYAFMLQVKEAHKAQHCNLDANAANTNSRYVESKHRDRSVTPLCGNPLTLMTAKADDPSSRSTFKLVDNDRWRAKSASRDATVTVDYPMVPTSALEWHQWRFYNDSKQKYGWVLELSKKQQHVQLCPNALGNTVCDALTTATTLSLEVEVSSQNPIIQLNFLKSYAPEMGVAKVWMDDNTKEYVLLNSQWSVEYSVTHTVTLSRTGLNEVSSTMKGDSMVLPSLSGGKHILNIAPAEMKPDKYKWKLLGVTSC